MQGKALWHSDNNYLDPILSTDWYSYMRYWHFLCNVIFDMHMQMDTFISQVWCLVWGIRKWQPCFSRVWNNYRLLVHLLYCTCMCHVPCSWLWHVAVSDEAVPCIGAMCHLQVSWDQTSLEGCPVSILRPPAAKYHTTLPVALSWTFLDYLLF